MAVEMLGPEWNISQKGEEIITENNTIKDKQKILKNALNADFKEIGAPVLNKVQSRSNVSQVVLQIQKIRNIGAPKANENSHVAPRMLKLILTDGDGYIQAIETASIPSLNPDKTPPGSKLLIHSAKLSSGYVLLDSSNCSLLGGQVPALCEKWELAKSVQHHNRQNSSSDGPPAWVNIGCKVQSDVPDKSFKSLDNKSQESKENTKFDMQRQDAIAEATSGAIRKVFGGGVKQPPQQTYVPRAKPEFQTRDRKGIKNRAIEMEVDDKPQKPSERVSLFDFLEDKLPANETQAPDNAKPAANKNFVRNAQSNPQYNKNNSFNNARYPGHQNSFNRSRNDFRPQTSMPPHRFEEYPPNQNNSNRMRNDFRPQNRIEDYPNNQNSNRIRNDFKPHTPQNRFDEYPPNQNSSNRMRNDFRPQASQNRAEDFPNNQNRTRNDFKSPTVPNRVEDDVNGLSNNLDKMSLNTQFASRSLKQHLNLGPQKKNSVENAAVTEWKVGDDCVAIYWEDGKYYNASVTAVTDRTCVVKFKGYGNVEEVLKSDCMPAASRDAPQRSPYTGPVEFRRSARTFRRQ